MDLGGQLDLLLLALLARGGPAHGYAVIAQLHTASDGVFGLAEGTVYPALHRLERSGALVSVTDSAAARPRRIYRLTRAGEVLLAERHRQWLALVDGVQKVVSPSQR